VRVLLAACDLAQPQQLPPLMAVLLPDLMAADEKGLDTAALVLFNTSRSLNLPLRELFGSEEAAAGVATRLVQLLAHASDEIFRAAWFTCCQLSVNVINRQLLLNAGLLQPAHFVRAMASSHVGVRIDSIVLLNLTTRGTARVLIEQRGLLPVILAACADTAAKVVANGISGLHSCVLAAEQPDAAQLRSIVLQACTSSAFPSATVTRLMSTDQKLADSLPNLIRAWSTLLKWPESAVDSARLHPLAQRLVDAGLLPLVEGQSHKDTGARTANDELTQ
jgi:hypothetical protein